MLHEHLNGHVLVWNSVLHKVGTKHYTAQKSFQFHEILNILILKKNCYTPLTFIHLFQYSYIKLV